MKHFLPTFSGMTETSLTHVLSGDLQSLGLEVKMKVIEWLVFHLKRTEWFMQEFGCWLKTGERNMEFNYFLAFFLMPGESYSIHLILNTSWVVRLLTKSSAKGLCFLVL